MVSWLEVFLMILFVAALADAATRRYPRSGGLSLSLRRDAKG
jgi:hypothetical protein